MKVLFTGGTGSVGKASVRRLLDDGHEVTVVGRRDEMEVPAGASYRACDINDYDGLHRVMKGHRAVVHLAAIPTPRGRPGRELFRVNDLGTFIVFEAAAELGINRIVGASSINAFGYFYGDRGFPIRYLPVDEAHEGVATDAYSFSKQVMEDIGRYFWERDRISSVMLRLPAVLSSERLTRWWSDAEPVRGLLGRLLALPDAEREAEVRRLSHGYDSWRANHRWDRIPRDASVLSEEDPWEGAITRDEHRLMSSRANLFTYVHDEDAAQAISKGLTAPFDGCHPLYVNARRNSTGRSVEELSLILDPPRPEVRASRPGDDTIVSIDRARELLGFEPEHLARG